jgi:hypothetical protein
MRILAIFMVCATAILGVDKEPIQFHSVKEILNKLPGDARPIKGAWSNFAFAKAEKWISENVQDNEIRTTVTILRKEVQAISGTNNPDESWAVHLLTRMPIVDFYGFKISPQIEHASSVIGEGITFSFLCTEKTAKRIDQMKVGFETPVEGTITKAAISYSGEGHGQLFFIIRAWQFPALQK